jgi:hypothetical protein
MKHGIKLHDAIYYKFKYTEINSTKTSITSHINYINNTTFTTQSYDSKENNISNDIYESLFLKTISLYDNICDTKSDIRYIAVDGTNTNDTKYNVIQNMGYFDINNNIPIDITYDGLHKNTEVSSFINYIRDHVNEFEKAVFICDRLYFTYELLHFLEKHNLKYIIRVKGNGNNLNVNTDVSKYNKNFNLINELKHCTRLIECKNTYNKIVYKRSTKNKKDKNTTYALKVINDCTLVTNLLDTKKYSNSTLLNLYRNRWSIEVYFKYIKSNFKFQYTTDKNSSNYRRTYVCEMILVYIINIIKCCYIKTNNIDLSSIPIKKKNKCNQIIIRKINKTNLTKGLFSELLYDIIKGSLTDQQLNTFCNSYIKICENTSDRHFPRTSKKPFSKWYLKGYSINSKIIKIIDAIINNRLDTLNNNEKTIATKLHILETKIS